MSKPKSFWAIGASAARARREPSPRCGLGPSGLVDLSAQGGKQASLLSPGALRLPPPGDRARLRPARSQLPCSSLREFCQCLLRSKGALAARASVHAFFSVHSVFFALHFCLFGDFKTISGGFRGINGLPPQAGPPIYSTSTGNRFINVPRRKRRAKQSE